MVIRLFIVSLLLLALHAPIVAAIPSPSFPDVRLDDWYHPYVQELVDHGIIQGYPNGKFGSWDPVNRAELSKILVNFKKIVLRPEKPFWKEHFFELVLSGLTLLGWIAVLRLSKRPISVNCPCKEEDLPDAGRKVPIMGEPAPPEATITNPKNQNTNWWM